MVPVVLILLVVLMSGAVLWVVAGDVEKPTSGRHAPVATVPAPAPAARRRRARGRRRPVLTEPVPSVRQPQRPQTTSAAFRGAPLPRHRARSGALLVVLAVLVGVGVAAVIAVVVLSLAFALRSAVTS